MERFLFIPLLSRRGIDCCNHGREVTFICNLNIKLTFIYFLIHFLSHLFLINDTLCVIFFMNNIILHHNKNIKIIILEKEMEVEERIDSMPHATV
jgi:hypothetical protein